MRCSAARKLISDYIDDDLNSKQRLSLESHLEICPDCQRLSKDFQSITDEAKELEKLSPSPQIWRSLKAKLNVNEQDVKAIRPQKREWFNLLSSPPKLKYALSSALVLLVIIIIVTFGLRSWMGKDILEMNHRQAYTLAKLDEAERHYQLALKALVEAVSSQRGNIDPQTADVIQKNLEIINSSITICQQAVHRDPDSVETRNYLLAAYMEKVDLLNEMMEIKKKSLQKPGEKTL